MTTLLWKADLVVLMVTICTHAAWLRGMPSDTHGPYWVAATGLMLASAMLALLPLVSRSTTSQVAAMRSTQLVGLYWSEDSWSLNGLSVTNFAISLAIALLAAGLVSTVLRITEEKPASRIVVCGL